MVNIISTTKVWKTYQTDVRVIHAIKDVSIDIPRGKKTCITGPSGSGKSTLLHLIGLLTTTTKGEIIFEGEPVQRMSDIYMGET